VDVTWQLLVASVRNIRWTESESAIAAKEGVGARSNTEMVMSWFIISITTTSDEDNRDDDN